MCARACVRAGGTCLVLHLGLGVYEAALVFAGDDRGIPVHLHCSAGVAFGHGANLVALLTARRIRGEGLHVEFAVLVPLKQQGGSQHVAPVCQCAVSRESTGPVACEAQRPCRGRVGTAVYISLANVPCHPRLLENMASRRSSLFHQKVLPGLSKIDTCKVRL